MMKLLVPFLFLVGTAQSISLLSYIGLGLGYSPFTNYYSGLYSGYGNSYYYPSYGYSSSYYPSYGHSGYNYWPSYSGYSSYGNSWPSYSGYSSYNNGYWPSYSNYGGYSNYNNWNSGSGYSNYGYSGSGYGNYGYSSYYRRK